MNERLKTIINYYFPNGKGGNISAFARSIGIGFQTVKNYVAGRDPSYEFLSAILNKYKELSAEWLMRGEGEMFKPSIFEADKEQFSKTLEASADKIKYPKLFLGGLKIGNEAIEPSRLDTELGAYVRRLMDNQDAKDKENQSNVLFGQLIARLDRMDAIDARLNKIEQSLEHNKQNEV